jgi:T5SS/PEP-CTERM-associated repeat protein
MQSVGSQGGRLFLLLLLGGAMCMPFKARGQLVDDGSTNILDGVSTNLAGSVWVGSNAPFTMLVLTNRATVTNIFGALNIGWNASANSNTVIIVGAGTVWTNFGFYVGFSGSYNQLSILDGAVVSGNDLSLGMNHGNYNKAIISGAGSFCTNNDLTEIETGVGNELIITNGGALAGRIAFVYGTSNSVTVTGSGSNLKCASLDLGNFGAGLPAYDKLIINNGGAVSNSGTCTIGNLARSNLVLVTDAGSSFRCGLIGVGHGGGGNQLVVSNGAVAAARYTYVEDNQGSNNRVIVTGPGSLLTTETEFRLGFTGASNLLIVTDGGALADNTAYIGTSAGTGFGNQAIIEGPHSLWTNGSDFYVGLGSARNQLVISNGARLFNAYGIIGYGSGANSNTVVVTGADSLWTNRSDVYVGWSGQSCQLLIANGAAVVSVNSSIAAQSSSVSNKVVVTDPGSLWKTLKTLAIGPAGSGANQLIVSNYGTVAATDLNVRGGPFGFNVVVSGGNIIATNNFLLYGSGPDFLTLNSGLIAADTFSWSGTKFEFNGGTLRTRNTFRDNTSAFKVGNGAAQATFELVSSGLHGFSLGLVVSSNAIVKGVGTVIGDVFVANGGTLSPGSALGQITVNGNVVFSDGSTNVMELNADDSTCDMLAGMTNLTYGGTLQLTNLAGQLTVGSSFRLFSATNYSGAFSAIIPLSPGPGLKWNTNELNVDGVVRVVALQTLAPAISAVEVSGANFQVRASGGIAYDPCYLLTTTNLGSPAAWEFCGTNTFDSSGNAIFNQTVFLDEKERFFRLQVQ